MFGLPMSTTLIMGGVMLFWVAYTIVFYVRTSNWAIEDADYDASDRAQGTAPQPGTAGPLDGPAVEGGRI